MNCLLKESFPQISSPICASLLAPRPFRNRHIFGRYLITIWHSSQTLPSCLDHEDESLVYYFHLCVSMLHQAHSHLRAFALALSSAWNPLSQRSTRSTLPNINLVMRLSLTCTYIIVILPLGITILPFPSPQHLRCSKTLVSYLGFAPLKYKFCENIPLSIYLTVFFPSSSHA